MAHTTAIRMLLLVMLSILGCLVFFSVLWPEKYERAEMPENAEGKIRVAPVETPWRPAGEAAIPPGDAGELIQYGKELIVNTPYYLGPRGSVRPVANSLSCQNCHLDAGTRVWGGNFGGAAATFPRFRNRSGTFETLEKKINDCFERSMNGRPLDTGSREMKAMIAYMDWLGKDVAEGRAPLGSGLIRVPYLDRAADPVRGRKVYAAKCQRCHGDNGQGIKRPGGIGYLYPPLWGENSYNTSAGIYRLGKFVSFVKYNMPYGVTFMTPELTDEEVWDVAAYVNSQPRPVRKFAGDWPDIAEKPVDHPFGPYADGFTEREHKYGPFQPIEKTRRVLTEVVVRNRR